LVSSIPNSNLGLFVTKRIAAGQLVTTFGGQAVYSDIDIEVDKSYRIQISESDYCLDGIKQAAYFGKPFKGEAEEEMLQLPRERKVWRPSPSIGKGCGVGFMSNQATSAKDSNVKCKTITIVPGLLFDVGLFASKDLEPYTEVLLDYHVFRSKKKQIAVSNTCNHINRLNLLADVADSSLSKSHANS